MNAIAIIIILAFIEYATGWSVKDFLAPLFEEVLNFLRQVKL